MHRILNRDLDERIFARQNLILREQELVQNSMTFRSRIEQKQDDSSKDNRKKNKKFSDKSKRHTLFNPGILLGKKERKFFFIHVRLITNSSELLTFLGRKSHYTDELSKQDRKDNLYSLFIIIIGIILSKLLSLY